MENFIQDSMRTESSEFNNLLDKDGNEYSKERLLHSALGMQTETAEFSDALKKSLFYGKELDVVNLKEELGDLFWYCAVALDELNSTFEDEQSRVIKKLKIRYPEKFTQDKAENRDLESERKSLEESQCI